MRGAILAALAGLCALAAPASASAQEAAAATPEIVVAGVQPGPRMWVVEDADSEVWILGVFNFLPKGVTWEPGPVARVLDRADRVIAQTRVKVSPFRAIDLLLTDRDLFTNPKKQTLAQVLPADLYARFAAARQAAGLEEDEYERLRPAYAGGALLAEHVDKAGLDGGKAPIKTVLKLADKRNVKITPLRTYKGKEAIQALGQVSDAAQIACLEATLSLIERGMPALRRAAEAWAVGDVASLRATPPPKELEVCEQEVLESVDFAQKLRDEGRAAYVEAVRDGLAAPGVRLILVDIDGAIAPDGLVATLRRQGYTVEGP